MWPRMAWHGMALGTAFVLQPLRGLRVTLGQRVLVLSFVVCGGVAASVAACSSGVAGPSALDFLGPFRANIA